MSTRILSSDLRALSICQGGEEPYELHVRYCVALAERVEELIDADAARLRASRLAPCHCGHPGAGCSCFDERRAAADVAETVR